MSRAGSPEYQLRRKSSGHGLGGQIGGASLEELKRHQPDWAVPDLRAITARELAA